MEASCWADDLKTFAFEGTSPWHFVDRPNNPYGYTNITTQAVDDRVDWAITEAVESLKNESPYPYVESTMMRYLIHFVGDSHQPLHTTSRYSPSHPDGDMGGNLVLIQYNDDINDLHKLWDSVIGYMAESMPRPLNSEDWGKLQAKAESIMQEYPREALADPLSDPDPTGWTIEGFIDAQLYAYNGITSGQKPTDAYLEQALKVAKRRIALGGYRLADIFSNLYSDEAFAEQVIA